MLRLLLPLIQISLIANLPLIPLYKLQSLVLLESLLS
jgi:hypothetical protein